MTTPIEASLPYDTPVSDDHKTQDAWHCVVHLLIPKVDTNGNVVDSQAAAEDYVAETLRGQFLDWGYVRAIDPETGEPDGMQTPIPIVVWDPYIEGTWGDE